MPRFRKIALEIEAWQVGSRLPAPQWLSDAIMSGKVKAHAHRVDHLVIGTLEGDMVANPGDWIIQGVRAELYPCKPAIFALTYELVPDPAPAARDLTHCPDGDGGYD